MISTLPGLATGCGLGQTALRTQPARKKVLKRRQNVPMTPWRSLTPHYDESTWSRRSRTAESPGPGRQCRDRGAGGTGLSAVNRAVAVADSDGENSAADAG